MRVARTPQCAVQMGAPNPCSSAAKMISNGAWVSKTATDWCTDIETLGGYIKTSFANYSRDVTSAVNSEPKEIDLDTDPDNALEDDMDYVKNVRHICSEKLFKPMLLKK